MIEEVVVEIQKMEQVAQQVAVSLTDFWDRLVENDQLTALKRMLCKAEEQLETLKGSFKAMPTKMRG